MSTDYLLAVLLTFAGFAFIMAGLWLMLPQQQDSEDDYP